MTRIDKHLKKLEAERRDKPVTAEMWAHWRAHPMTEIFFLDHDIQHAKLLTNKSSDSEYYVGFTQGRIDQAAETIDYEPHEITEANTDD